CCRTHTAPVHKLNHFMDACVPEDGGYCANYLLVIFVLEATFWVVFCSDTFHAESLRAGEAAQVATAAEAALKIEEAKEFDDIAGSNFVFADPNSKEYKVRILVFLLPPTD